MKYYRLIHHLEVLSNLYRELGANEKVNSQERTYFSTRYWAIQTFIDYLNDPNYLKGEIKRVRDYHRRLEGLPRE